jgi:hypothetical protein
MVLMKEVGYFLGKMAKHRCGLCFNLVAADPMILITFSISVE